MNLIPDSSFLLTHTVTATITTPWTNLIPNSNMIPGATAGQATNWTYAGWDINRFLVFVPGGFTGANGLTMNANGGVATSPGAGYSALIAVVSGQEYCLTVLCNHDGANGTAQFGIVSAADKAASNAAPATIYAQQAVNIRGNPPLFQSVTWTATLTGDIAVCFWGSGMTGSAAWLEPQLQLGSTFTTYIPDTGTAPTTTVRLTESTKWTYLNFDGVNVKLIPGGAGGSNQISVGSGASALDVRCLSSVISGITPGQYSLSFNVDASYLGGVNLPRITIVDASSVVTAGSIPPVPGCSSPTVSPGNVAGTYTTTWTCVSGMAGSLASGQVRVLIECNDCTVTVPGQAILICEPQFEIGVATAYKPGSSSVSTIGELSDVSESLITAGQVLTYTGTAWANATLPPVSLRLKLCSADFTPAAVGTDLGGLTVVPCLADAPMTPVSWNVVDIFLRVETAASAGTTSVQIQRSTGTGAFVNAGALNTTPVDIAAGANEPATRPAALAVTTVNSGDKLLPFYSSLGTGAAGFTLYVLLEAAQT